MLESSGKKLPMMSSATRKQSLFNLAFILCISNILPVACHTCNLDSGSYKYCKQIMPSGGVMTETIFSIYQCRDICDRKRCAAFEYHVIKNAATDENRECWLHFMNSGSTLQLIDAAKCDDNEWWYSWILPGPDATRKGHGRVWDLDCKQPELKIHEPQTTSMPLATTDSAPTTSTPSREVDPLPEELLK